MRAPRATPLVAVLATVAALAGCGPAGTLETRGGDADPPRLLGVLPSPGELRGGPAEPVGARALAAALMGRTDP